MPHGQANRSRAFHGIGGTVAGLRASARSIRKTKIDFGERARPDDPTSAACGLARSNCGHPTEGDCLERSERGKRRLAPTPTSPPVSADGPNAWIDPDYRPADLRRKYFCNEFRQLSRWGHGRFFWQAVQSRFVPIPRRGPSRKPTTWCPLL